MSGMSATERNELKSLITKRVKVEKQKAKAHAEQLVANANAEMNRRFHIEDLGIQQVVDDTRAEVEKLKSVMNARFDQMGVSEDLRGRIELSYWPGGYRGKDHRAELRRKARENIEAAVQRRLAEIDAWELEARTDLARSAITSDQAVATLAALPDAAEALPAVEDILGPVEEQPLAVIESGHDAKRQAILGALQGNPSASNREIGRLLGVDHKTVGKVRAEAGEISGQGGDLPSKTGEIPGPGEGRDEGLA